MTALTLRSKGKRYPVRIELHPKTGKLIFRKSPFGLKNEIKAMRGARWNPDHKFWTVDNCPRNHFQLKAMMVEPENPNPYEWFERPLEIITDIERPLKEQQVDMVSRVLTYRYQILAAEMGLGKTLTAIEIMERLNELYGWYEGDPDGVLHNCWFVGPRSALESVGVDMHKWAVEIEPRLMTYERLTLDCEKLMAEFGVPQCVIFDECSNLKAPSAQRSLAAQTVTDAIREKHGTEGCVVLMSGTVTAKLPSDIWKQAEIAWPGFLREGTFKSFERRYAIIEMQEDMDGTKFPVRLGWKEHEVEKLPDRLSGLMSVYRKEDYLSLPTRTYHVRQCPPSKKIKRVAQALIDAAPNTITGLTWLRALSSGFQYDETGEPGDNGERALVETKCPKDDALREILSEDESRGRIIVFASFQGSLDRVKRICQAEGWDTIMVDGRGWNCYDSDNVRVKQHILDYWANNENKTVFIGNPQSCRFGLTLVEAKTAVVYDQNFSAECRLQSLDRNYRIGQDQAVRVIDLIHLPIDQLVLDTLTENKRLEDLSLGILRESLDIGDS